MEFDELSNRVIGCAIEVHRHLGPGLFESAYEQCLAGVTFACNPHTRSYSYDCAVGSLLGVAGAVNGCFVSFVVVRNMTTAFDKFGLVTMRVVAACAAYIYFVTCAVAPTIADEQPADFIRDVLPILSLHCHQCHGPDHAESSLRLHQRDAALKGGDSGAVIVPNHSEKSLLIARISATDETERMPPPDAGDALSSDEIAVLRKWIDAGAHWPIEATGESDKAVHWAFLAPLRPTVPELDWKNEGQESAIANPIDAFLGEQLRRQGLRFSSRADRYTLVRRLSLDLIGLPPTPEEVSEFVHDTRPDAYSRLVERLLASPHYGERWASMWLDLARYADSTGYSDYLRPNVWPYRDWLIDAFNRNLTFDQFTIEQIAGDLLPAPTPQQLLATAMHRNTMTNSEAGTDNEEFRVAAVKDRANVTAQVWMGLTIGCAQCHSHKYDPISIREYYEFYAFFNQSQDANREESPLLPIVPPSRQEAWFELQKRRAELNGELPELNATLKERESLDREIAALAVTTPVLGDLPIKERRTTRMLLNGSFLTPGEPVQPGVPEAFHPLPEGAPSDRLGLARWLVDRQNPLTARVMVNRVWSQLFGTGIVETEEDFGIKGSPPSHPELLDWLAVEFMDGGWDIKALLKLIVASSAYQQSSKVTPGILAQDPRNRLLARAPRFRLTAETVRDQALSLGGLLSHKIGGPSVYPPQPEGVLRKTEESAWATSQGEDRYRRGLYIFWKRTAPYPSLATFDAPSRETCTLRRVRSNTPLQSLVTLNDPVYVEAAQSLARRIMREGGTTNEERVRFAIQVCLVRPPRDDEVFLILDLFNRQIARYSNDLVAAREAIGLPQDPPGGINASPSDLAAWTLIANVLLNHDALLTRN